MTYSGISGIPQTPTNKTFKSYFHMSSQRRDKRVIDIFIIWRFRDETKHAEHRKTDLLWCHKFC